MKTPWTKEKPAPVAVLPEDLKAAVKAEAHSYFGPKWRAEGKAQATLAMKDIAAKLEARLSQERVENGRKLAALADAVNKMMIVTNVLRELAVTGARVEWDGLSAQQRRAEVDKLCTLEQIKMTAVPGKPS